jgi:hypothetical protein
MPHLDFREALSSPDEKEFSSAEDLVTVARVNQSRPAAKKIDSPPPVPSLGHSGWANVVYVTIASLGGILCAFYFFNGAELLRAAAAWSGEFLYPRPAAVAMNSEITNGSGTNPSATKPESQQSDRDKKEPFAKVWPSSLAQTDPFANFGPVGNTSLNSIFGSATSPLNQLGQLPRGADTLFQNFYKTAVTMAPKNVARNAGKTSRAARKNASNAQQTIAAQSNSGSAAQTAASAQNSAMIQAARNQSQSLMGAGMHGGGLGGALGGVGGASAGGMVSGVLNAGRR